jgi:hypothetical protein
LGLPEPLQRDRSVAVFVRNEAKPCERPGWPTFGRAAGGFGHDEEPAGAQERRRALGRHGRRPEAAGYDQVRLASAL